jgi:guanylate kinase
VDGKDFHFLTEPDFVARRDRGEFAEWALVHGNYYGTPALPLEAALARGEDVLLDIDTQGARQLRERYPEAVSVFIMAPSLAELAARLRERKSDAPGEIARRLARARQEIATWREYDYLIINRDVKEAVERLATIIQGERWRTSRLTIRFPDVEVPD